MVALAPDFVGVVTGSDVDLGFKLLQLLDQNREVGQGVGEGEPTGLKEDLKDLEAYLALQRAADALEHPDITRYWKAAPYLLSFMGDQYKLKRRFKEALDDLPTAEGLTDTVAAQGVALPWERVERYQPLDLPSPPLRSLLRKVVGGGLWKLLWMQPSLPYYAAEGPFADANAQQMTKQLVFSQWRVAPKAIACLVSYAAERHMMRSFAEAPRNTPEAREQQARLLDFAVSQGRLTGMPVLGLLYPSFALADLGDPIQQWLGSGEPGLMALEEVRRRVRRRVEERLQALPAYRSAEGKSAEGGRDEEAWYYPG